MKSEEFTDDNTDDNSICLNGKYKSWAIFTAHVNHRNWYKKNEKLNKKLKKVGSK